MKDDIVYLNHIIDAINLIEKYIKNYNYLSFCNKQEKIDAVVRELEIIGEAANNISKEFRKKYKNIPWKKIISTRNYLIHGYFDVNEKLVWITCKKNLPELKKLLKEIIK